MEAIMKYATLDQTTCTQSSKQSVAVALLATCHSWRAFVTCSLCSEYRILIDCSRNSVVTSFAKWPRHLLCAPNLPSASLVKKVRLNIALWSSLMDGSALQMFVNSQLSSIVFPAAHTLAVSIIDVAGVTNCSTDEIDRANKFVSDLSRSIRSMMPNVRQIDISWPNVYHVGLKQGLVGILNSSTAGLYHGIKQVSFTEYGGFEFPATIEPAGLNDITYLSFKCKSSISSFLGLARACSSSLIKLTIHDFPKDPTGPLYDEKGTASAVYSNLQKLYVAQDIGIQGLSLPKTKGIDHFPQLRSLEINCQYPFGDDVLLRGNADTIEHICIPLDKSFMNMNSKSNIFLPERFKRLRSIKLLNYYGAHEMSQYDIDAINAFVFNVSRSAAGDNLQAVRWGGLSERKRLFYGLTHNQKLRNLRVVELSRSIFDFAELVAILKAMPYLQRLWFSLDKKKHLVDGIAIPALPSYLIKNFCPLAKYLNSVTFDKESKASVKQMAEAAMMLVLVSPNLVLSSIYTAKSTGFHSAIGCAIKRNPFKEYVDRLSPLTNA
ncbi:hypothetical protein J3B02_002414 [Coemansia erecta]|nr:hypothetical protein J3B02_002414 [Coemansia erecta]